MGKKRTATVGEVGSAAEEREKKIADLKAKKKTLVIERGRFYIGASYNNIRLTATNERGEAIASVSSGQLGFRGPKKATPYAASKVAETVLERLSKVVFNEAEVFMKGIGPGREAAVRYLANQGINIVAIHDVTPIPHNGPRPRKPRRV